MSGKAVLSTTLALTLAIATAPLAAAAAPSTVIDFSATGYTVGALKPAGQNGWIQAKVADYSLVENSSYAHAGLPAFGRSLQFSNATIPSGGTHLVSPLIDAAGEPSTTALANTFDAKFTVASATGLLQEGLGVDVALDGASRYGGVINLRHTAAGLEIGSYWVPSDATTADNANWRSAVFTTVDATVPHTVRFVATFLTDQPDAVQVFVDDALVSGGSGVTTWEYYNTIAASGGDRSVDSLSFKSSASAPTVSGIGYTAGIPALPSAAGNGFLFADISYAVSNAAPPLPTVEPDLADAPSGAPDATITLADDSVSNGQLEATASGFLPYENVWATFYPDPTFGGWFQADVNGALSVTVPLPSGLTFGAHTIELTAQTTGRIAAATFTKIPVPLPTTPPTLPAEADPSPDAALVLSETSVTGTSIGFSATGYLPYENVFATVFAPAAFGGWFQADGEGAIAGTVVLAADLAYGSHVLQLTGTDAQRTAAATFTKAAVALPTEPPTLPLAPDANPDTVAELTDTTVSGASLQLSASGFGAFENVSAVFFPQPTFGGWFQADANGVISGTIALPAGLPAGSYTLQFTGSVTAWVASVEFERVVAAVPDPGAPVPDPGTPLPTRPLAATGMSIAGPSILALSLLVAGAMALIVSRRTRRGRPDQRTEAATKSR